MAIEYKLVLTGDGETPALADAEIPFSSLSYSMNGQGTNSIDCVIEGNDYDAIIAARSNGDLEFYIDDVLFCSAALSEISISKDPRRYSVSLNAVSTDQSYTYAAEAIELDSIINFYTVDDGETSFQTPYSNRYYLPGATVEYDGIEYTIAEINFSYSGGAPSWTLKEGLVSIADSPASTGCTDTLVDGVTYSGTLGVYDTGYTCYRQRIQLGDTSFCNTYYAYGYFFVPYQFMYFKFLNFNLPVDSDITIEITGSFTDIDWITLDVSNPIGFRPVLSSCSGKDAYLGFEAVLANGELTAFENFKGDVVDSFGAGVVQEISLDAGDYTLVLVNMVSDYPPAGIAYTIDFNVVP